MRLPVSKSLFVFRRNISIEAWDGGALRYVAPATIKGPNFHLNVKSNI